MAHLLFFGCCLKTSVSHHTLQGVLRGWFHLFLTVYISVYPDFCYYRHLQDLCKILTIDTEWADLNEWFACHLPACPPLLCIFPSCSSLASTREQEEPRGVMSLHLFPSTWIMKADLKQDQAFLNISSWQFAWKKASLHGFSGFHQTLAKIHRYLWLLLLSKC